MYWWEEMLLFLKENAYQNIIAKIVEIQFLTELKKKKKIIF